MQAQLVRGREAKALIPVAQLFPGQSQVNAVRHGSSRRGGEHPAPRPCQGSRVAPRGPGVGHGPLHRHAPRLVRRRVNDGLKGGCSRSVGEGWNKCFPLLLFPSYRRAPTPGSDPGLRRGGPALSAPSNFQSDYWVPAYLITLIT